MINTIFPDNMGLKIRKNGYDRHIFGRPIIYPSFYFIILSETLYKNNNNK